MNFRWKEAVWLALDDCGENPDTQGVYLNVQKYRELTEFQRGIDNQRVMQKYKNTVRNILNNFRRQGIIEGVKENPKLKYGQYCWAGTYALKENRKEIRRKIQADLHTFNRKLLLMTDKSREEQNANGTTQQ